MSSTINSIYFSALSKNSQDLKEAKKEENKYYRNMVIAYQFSSLIDLSRNKLASSCYNQHLKLIPRGNGKNEYSPSTTKKGLCQIRGGHGGEQNRGRPNRKVDCDSDRKNKSNRAVVVKIKTGII